MAITTSRRDSRAVCLSVTLTGKEVNSICGKRGSRLNGPQLKGGKMRYGRHPKWDEIDKLLDKITDHLGHSIYDNRCGKSWDVGQAVCAEAYGPNWMKNPTFREWDQLPDTDSPEPYYYECAVKMANGYIPEWTKEAT